MGKVRGPHDAVDTEFVPMLKTARVAHEGQIHLTVNVATWFVIERRKVIRPTCHVVEHIEVERYPSKTGFYQHHLQLGKPGQHTRENPEPDGFCQTKDRL